ncbi:aerotolerance regulator BatA [Vibrio breoganii]|uniref:VWA domain-containing protein n=1 Tax=Vibrio breoganii TaxID=553239 RepID=A0ABX1UBR9_9VIBR|nr:VWA domain-containing protein [Vibrio breoganii]NMO73553.1 VWA domain-containing protein [Vibrio breoganii]NMR70745.1 VWA domain-containing protein [Vibrio breoganii]PMG02087.1 aerotolerance regulator BatA [Vibrio breoganii]PML88446.1 aerotolerance regulator BatA [Vibrio breoganii]
MLDSSLELLHPYWLLALPLPLLVHWLIPAYRTKQSAIKVPFFGVLLKALGELPSEGASQLRPSLWQRCILVMSWCLVIFALCKPTILGEPQTRERLGRDVMVVVDLSGSMAEQDFTSQSGDKISRLDAVKEVLETFVESRKGDRLGLILFGDAAFIQTPFTADQTVWLNLLQQTDVGMAGASTYLGDAIGLSIKVFENSAQTSAEGAREKVAVVLTDGNDTGSFVEPIDAAKVASAKGVKIHVIAIGDPATVGEQALDMDTIARIASETGGEAFEALDREALARAYEEIGELEPQLYESSTYRPKTSVHAYLIMLVVTLYLLAFMVSTVKRMARTNTNETQEEKTDV